MNAVVSVFLAWLLFLSGFSNGPALHYCYSSGHMKADIARLLEDEAATPEHSSCAEAKADACCAAKKKMLAQEDGKRCCDDFEFKIELKEYSVVQWLNPVPAPALLQLFILPLRPWLLSAATGITADNTYSWADPGLLWQGLPPLFIRLSVFRI